MKDFFNLRSNKELKLVLVFFAVLFFPTNLLAYDADPKSDVIKASDVDEIYILRGELTNLEVNALTRVSITDPGIADITDAQSEEIVLIGKDAGQTTLFIWDADGKKSINIHVSAKDLRGIQSRIKQLLDDAIINEVKLDANAKEGKVIISGEVPENKLAVFEEIVNEFPGDVINLVKTEEISDLVQVDMQISELSETLDKALGIDWTGTPNDALTANYNETLPTFDGKPGDFFKIGDFARTTALQAKVNAIIEEGKGRVLSKPKLVVESGQEASFLVGGEIPIRTTTSSSSGATQENVSFKEYGVGMTVTPTVKKANKIEILLTTEISDIDAANRVGNDVAFTTRSAQTQVLLDDAQTVIIAGLIKSNQGEKIRRVPFVSNVPIVGILFRNRSKSVPDSDTEVVISMTPHIINRNRSRFVQKQEEEMNQTAQKHKSYEQKGLSLAESGSRPFYAGIPPEMADYVRTIQQKITDGIVFPKEARENGWQGTVKLGMMILQDGTLAYAMVKETSGFDLFDQYAVSTAKNAAPFDKFPSNTSLQELNVVIPIVYSLKNK